MPPPVAESGLPHAPPGAGRDGRRALPLFAALLFAMPGVGHGQGEPVAYSVWLEAAFDTDGQVVATHAWDGQPGPLVSLAEKTVRNQRLPPLDGGAAGRRVDRFAVTFGLAESGDGDLVVESVSVERRPRPIATPQPGYPVQLLAHGYEGSVKVQFKVTEDGRTADVEVVESEPPGKFDLAAVNAVKEWRFEPQVLPGELIDPVYIQPIDFEQGL